ncbi:hypothetical protein D3C87_1871420 [compost metagenome]
MFDRTRTNVGAAVRRLDLLAKAAVGTTKVQGFTDFVIILDCRKSPIHLYAPRPFSFQDLHEHPLGASRLSFLFALPRALDARETPGLSTSEQLRHCSPTASEPRLAMPGILTITEQTETYLWNG